VEGISIVKITQIRVREGDHRQDLTPAQSMILEEINRRTDEVFRYGDDTLLSVFPRLKTATLNWSLWALYTKGLIGKNRIRVSGRLATVFGSKPAMDELARHIDPIP
jgi:hypothetical protein